MTEKWNPPNMEAGDYMDQPFRIKKEKEKESEPQIEPFQCPIPDDVSPSVRKAIERFNAKMRDPVQPETPLATKYEALLDINVGFQEQIDALKQENSRLRDALKEIATAKDHWMTSRESLIGIARAALSPTAPNVAVNEDNKKV